MGFISSGGKVTLLGFVHLAKRPRLLLWIKVIIMNKVISGPALEDVLRRIRFLPWRDGSTLDLWEMIIVRSRRVSYSPTICLLDWTWIKAQMVCITLLARGKSCLQCVNLQSMRLDQNIFGFFAMNNFARSGGLIDIEVNFNSSLF